MALTKEARETIRWSGITIAAYIRDQAPYSGQDGRTWRGDKCGCIDDRCVGYHHDEHDECGCLPVLIDETKQRIAAVVNTSADSGEAGR